MEKNQVRERWKLTLKGEDGEISSSKEMERICAM